MSKQVGVDGTAQNSAGNGFIAALPTAEEIQFEGTSLGEGSDKIMGDLIAEYRGATQMVLQVHASDGLSAPEAQVQVAARIESLRQGLLAAGLGETEFLILAADRDSP